MRRVASEDLVVCEAATLGPWKHDDRSGCTGIRTGDSPGLSRDYADIICYSSKGAVRTEGCGWDMDPQTRKDFAFIALSREALPYWINRAVELEKALGLAKFGLEIECDNCRRVHAAEGIHEFDCNPACPYNQALALAKEVLS